MSDLSWIPEDIRPKVEEALGYSERDWREMTTGGNPQFLVFFVAARKLDEIYRRTQIVQKPGVIEQMLNNQPAEDPDGEMAKMILAVFCLPNETLDLVISTFSPEMRAATGCAN